MSIGAGLSHAFASNIYTQSKYQSDPFPESLNESSTKFAQWDFFDMHYNLTAGFHYRLDPKTSLGIEYTFEKFTYPQAQGPNVFLKPVTDCICYYYEPGLRPNMNSFSVSLRHNILD